MNHSPARILAELLTTGSGSLLTEAADDVDWPVFVSSEPDTPSDCATIYDTEGIQEIRKLSGANIVRYGFQIRIRSIDYEEGWAKAHDIASYLETVHAEEVTVDSDTYEIDNVSQTSPISALGPEEGTRRRMLFTLNGLIRVEGV